MVLAKFTRSDLPGSELSTFYACLLVFVVYSSYLTNDTFANLNYNPYVSARGKSRCVGDREV